ncbi:MAG TPA: sensor histidine kinase [Actinocrinis sp.]|jgi:signal transduction histidine kinase
MGAISKLRGALREHPHAADLLVAAVVFAATLLTATGARTSGGATPGPSGVVFAVVACASLVVRRWWPLVVLVISGSFAEGYVAQDPGRGIFILLAPLIALYTVAEQSQRRRGLVASGLAVGAIVVMHALLRPALLGPENLALIALAGLAVAAGDSSRNRRAYLAEVEQRAARAEQERDRDARRRVTEERLRIARDLHDSVGHHLALISVQAGVADRMLDGSPRQAHDALAHVKAASRSALGELRDTIGLLREPDEPAAPTEPMIGLDGLDDLVASFRRSGLEIERQVEGASRRLAPAVDLTAYRVIQESLTNVYKHAGGPGNPGARISLAYGAAALSITIDNDGSAGATDDGGGAMIESGHGIVGMRERIAAIGGELRAGPRPGGGFRVAATLPLQPARLGSTRPPSTQGRP